MAHSFLDEIKHNKEHDFLVVLSDDLAPQIDVTSFFKNFEFKTYSIHPSVYKAFSGRDYHLNNFENNFKAEIVFSVFGATYWKPKAKHICGFAKPDYIYKESPFFNQINIIQKIKLALMETVHMYDFRNNNTLLIAENEDVSLRLRKKVSQKVVTVSNTFNQVFKDNKDWDNRLNVEAKDVDVKILTISANYPHKNLAIIKKVIPILKYRYPDLKFKFYLSITAEELNVDPNDVLNENIQFFGKININQCPGLYSQCDFLFLPTLLECFSASYCEAMYMNLPILTSNISFAKGICGDAAIYFDPMDANDIATAIYKLANDKVMQKELVQKGKDRLEIFDTSKIRAEKYLQIITTHK